MESMDRASGVFACCTCTLVVLRSDHILVVKQLIGVLLLLVRRRIHVVTSLSQRGRALNAVGATIIRHLILDGSRVGTFEAFK